MYRSVPRRLYTGEKARVFPKKPVNLPGVSRAALPRGPPVEVHDGAAGPCRPRGAGSPPSWGWRAGGGAGEGARLLAESTPFSPKDGTGIIAIIIGRDKKQMSFVACAKEAIKPTHNKDPEEHGIITYPNFPERLSSWYQRLRKQSLNTKALYIRKTASIFLSAVRQVCLDPGIAWESLAVHVNEVDKKQ